MDTFLAPFEHDQYRTVGWRGGRATVVRPDNGRHRAVCSTPESVLAIEGCGKRHSLLFLSD